MHADPSPGPACTLISSGPSLSWNVVSSESFVQEPHWVSVIRPGKAAGSEPAHKLFPPNNKPYFFYKGVVLASRQQFYRAVLQCMQLN